MTERAPLISMQLMGKDYSVPSGLTIMAAIEYAGYKLVRGAGCRGGPSGLVHILGPAALVDDWNGAGQRA